MIQSVTITNPANESLEMILAQPELSGFVVKSIDGLGPASANINMTELATIDGAIDNTARLETRDIVLSLVFLDAPTIEDARLKSYKYFPIKKKVRFTVKTDNRTCFAEGRVEKNEPKIFQKQEGTTVTIKCSDPYFYSEEDNLLKFYGADPMFELPFDSPFDPESGASLMHLVDPPGSSTGIPVRTGGIHGRDENNDYVFDAASVTQIEEEHHGTGFRPDEEEIQDEDPHQGVSFENGYDPIGIEFGSINIITEATLFYEGDEDVGVKITIHVDGSASGITIWNSDTRDSLSISDEKLKALINDQNGLKYGDKIIIDTTRGNKSVTFLREGVETNILNALEKPIGWLQIVKGYNTFTYVAETGMANLRFEMLYKTRYEGV